MTSSPIVYGIEAVFPRCSNWLSPPVALGALPGSCPFRGTGNIRRHYRYLLWVRQVTNDVQRAYGAGGQVKAPHEQNPTGGGVAFQDASIEDGSDAVFLRKTVLLSMVESMDAELVMTIGNETLEPFEVHTHNCPPRARRERCLQCRAENPGNEFILAESVLLALCFLPRGYRDYLLEYLLSHLLHSDSFQNYASVYVHIL